MRSKSTKAALALALGFAAPTLAASKAGSLTSDPDKAAAVVDVFRTAWAGYAQHAFPNDNLVPFSNSFNNDRNGWGASAVDALSTAIIMRQVDIVNTILNFIPTIDFTTTAVANEGISVFETTIRYLGGLVSSYDLLTGPYSDLGVDSVLVQSLLTQAQSLADGLKVAFDTPSGFPDSTVLFNPNKRNAGSASNTLAESGTLILEWTRLSDLTGDPEYGQLAQKGESFLLNHTGVPEAFPGLGGTSISTANGQYLDDHGSWNGGDDSYYEYLIKMYLYDPTSFTSNKDQWVLAVDSLMKHLASHPSTRPDLTFLAQFQGQTIFTTSGHLTSFAGGSLIVGGVLLQVQEYIDFGLSLTESYWQTYNQTASGIGPEGFNWVDSSLPSGGVNPNPPDAQEAFYATAGFWVSSGVYILRPETVESLWYAYRTTGDEKWRDMAWEAFQAISTLCRVGSGYSSIVDVTQANGGGFFDEQESFFFAEVLKYLYLIFGDQDAEVQFQASGQNKFVFNTEAHPVKVRGA